jgi:hypothetical protein
MDAPVWLYTTPVEIRSVLATEAEKEADEDMDAGSINAHTAQRTFIPLNHAERECELKIAQSIVIQTPPERMCKYATTAVSEDTARPAASTSNVPRINAAK